MIYMGVVCERKGIGKDGNNNTVYHTQKLLQCLLLSFARVICTRCLKTEIKKDCAARAERFTRRWPFHTAVTVSDGGDGFGLLSCT